MLRKSYSDWLPTFIHFISFRPRKRVVNITTHFHWLTACLRDRSVDRLVSQSVNSQSVSGGKLFGYEIRTPESWTDLNVFAEAYRCRKRAIEVPLRRRRHRPVQPSSSRWSASLFYYIHIYFKNSIANLGVVVVEIYYPLTIINNTHTRACWLAGWLAAGASEEKLEQKKEENEYQQNISRNSK